MPRYITFRKQYFFRLHKLSILFDNFHNWMCPIIPFLPSSITIRNIPPRTAGLRDWESVDGAEREREESEKVSEQERESGNNIYKTPSKYKSTKLFSNNYSNQ